MIFGGNFIFLKGKLTKRKINSSRKKGLSVDNHPDIHTDKHTETCKVQTYRHIHQIQRHTVRRFTKYRHSNRQMDRQFHEIHDIHVYDIEVMRSIHYHRLSIESLSPCLMLISLSQILYCRWWIGMQQDWLVGNVLLLFFFSK